MVHEEKAKMEDSKNTDPSKDILIRMKMTTSIIL
jgi:hypothetical protein